MRRQGVIPLLAFAIAFGAYLLIYSRYLPHAGGTVGHDYSLFLPHLLDGYFWYLENGLWEVPWFTPSFCGGIPVFANPQTPYYSIPQLITLWVDPLRSIQLTLFVLSALAFWGTYALARQAFDVSVAAALVAATIFMFNGFFVTRIVTGHLTYHAFALLPWLAWFCLRPDSGKNGGRMLRYAVDVLAIGLLFAYAVYAGAVNVWPIFGLSLVALELLQRVAGRGSGIPFARLLAGGGLALVLSAAKLTAAFSYLSHYPRDYYPLPGLAGIWGLLETFYDSVFLGHGLVASSQAIRNNIFDFGAHEFQFGITVVPLYLVVVGTFFWMARNDSPASQVLRRRWPYTLLLVLLTVVPLAVNYYDPAWNALLKKVPFIKNSASLFRWFAVYLLPVVIAAAWGLDRILDAIRRKILIALCCGIAVVFLQSRIPPSPGDLWGQNYDPSPVVEAYRAARESGSSPPVTHIREEFSFKPRNIAANDVLVSGASQLACYEPMFGYQLQAYIYRSIHVGPVTDITGDELNLKNPACYAYPEANSCRPGDHFLVSERASAERFAARRPYPFDLPPRQILANWVSLVTIPLTILLLVAATVIRRRFRWTSIPS